ncbi:glycoside hydrolase [Apiospora phragmitis]|uniref:Alpha-galactosidase n=1 Tax=Apiospora phragmitis TaxID=2905665 RepID=A0ABR1X7B4_9PEZI
MIATLLLLGFLNVGDALVSPDGTGRLPAMGWNSWNEYGCDINDDVFIRVAELMVNLGLKDLGYQYVNIDDCWSVKGTTRDNATRRIIPDPVKFPRGIKHVADEMHARGLKLGIYGDAGTQTCGGYPGSLGYEEVDAAAWSEWGVDCESFPPSFHRIKSTEEWVDVPYMYPDDGGSPDGYVPPGYDWSTSNSSIRYNRMRDALLAQNHTIQYSLCIWGHANVVAWRMYSDIYPAWTGTHQGSQALMPILNQAAFYGNVSNFWGRNDWDMLEVGNGNLTLEENRSHFALWAALKSPLVIGTRLDAIRPEILAVLKAEELIAFNQDPVYGAGARPYRWDGLLRGVHAFLLNTKEAERDMELEFAQVPGLEQTATGRGPYLVHDMWTGEDIGIFSESVVLRVKRHDTAAVRITTVDGKGKATMGTNTTQI